MPHPQTRYHKGMTLVIVNKFDAGPHADGELVLRVRDQRWEMEVQVRNGTYYVYAFRLNDEGKHHYTRLPADSGTTPAQARERARNWWKMIQGEQ